MGPRWQEVARKPIKVGNLMAGLVLLVPIVTHVTPGTIVVRISDTAQR